MIFIFVFSFYKDLLTACLYSTIIFSLYQSFSSPRSNAETFSHYVQILATNQMFLYHSWKQK